VFGPQRHAAQANQAVHDQQRNKAAVEGDLDRRMRLGGQLDADTHAGEQEAGGDHPQGLHAGNSEGGNKRRRILPGAPNATVGPKKRPKSKYAQRASMADCMIRR
jgi:hypothetical protein